MGDRPQKCAGGFPGPCDNEPGTPWTPLWCPECDEKRKAAISQSLKDILASFPSSQAPPTAKEGNDAS